MGKRVVLAIVIAIAIGAIVHWFTSRSGIKLQTTFITDPSTPMCRTSQIEVTFGSPEVVGSSVTTWVYFTNHGAQCRLNKFGPTIEMFRGRKMLFGTMPDASYVPGSHPVTLRSGLSVDGNYSVTGASASWSPVCKLTSATSVAFAEIGTPADSTIHLKRVTTDLCPNEFNFTWAAY